MRISDWSSDVCSSDLLTLRLNGFSWLFSVLILGIGGLVVLYARYYMSSDDPVSRFFAFLMAFMGSMLGMVLSGNQIGRAHVCTPITYAQLVCRLMFEKRKTKNNLMYVLTINELHYTYSN